MSIYILDTETTGVTAKDQIIELAHVRAPSTELKETLQVILNLINRWGVKRGIEEASRELTIHSELFQPTVPIHPEAFKVHGKSLLSLLGCRLAIYAKSPEDCTIMIGHNIAFDYRFLGKPEGVNLICTLALVKKLRKEHPVWKEFEIEDNKLDSYMSTLYPELTFSEAHNAKDDCIKVILLLCKLLPTIPEIETWDALHNYINPKKEEKK